MANEKYITLDNLTQFKSNYDTQTNNKFARRATVEDIQALIPEQASASNQLADKNFVNSSIATNTATYRGDYNVVTDLGLTINATNAQVIAALITKMASLGITPENNDYCYVKFPDPVVSTQFTKFDRYKYNGTTWLYEYTLNNSSFTAEQWAAINSGITSSLVSKITANETAITNIKDGQTLDSFADVESALSGKQDTLVSGTNIKTVNNNSLLGSGNIQIDAPIQSIQVEGDANPLTPDANGKVTIPAEEPDTMDVAEATAVPIVTSVDNSSTDNQMPTAKAVNDAINDSVENLLVEYNDTLTYAIGDVCSYQGKIYMCNTTISVAESWDSAHWDETTIGDLLEALDNKKANNSALEGKQDVTTIDTTSTSPITLANNTSFRLGTISALTINAPSSYSLDFTCEVIFTADTGISMTYSAVSPTWSGDDVSGGVFTPVAGKSYTIIFYNSATSSATPSIQAVVRGV